MTAAERSTPWAKARGILSPGIGGQAAPRGCVGREVGTATVGRVGRVNCGRHSLGQTLGGGAEGGRGTTSCAVACAPRQLHLAMHSPGGQEGAPGDATCCQHMLGFRVKCCCSTCFSWEMFSQNGKAQETREQAHVARGEHQGLGPKT